MTKRAQFEKEYQLRMQKSQERANNTSLGTRVNSRFEYNYPDVTIDNLGSMDQSVKNDFESQIPATAKNAVLAFSSENPLRREFSTKKVIK